MDDYASSSYRSSRQGSTSDMNYYSYTGSRSARQGSTSNTSYYPLSSARSSRQGSTSIDAHITSSRNNSTSTQSSYFSASNLSPQNEYRQIHAASARAQVLTAPTTGPRHGYPKTYENREQLASTKSPYNEYPLMPQRGNDFATEKNRPGRKADPGPLRAIYSDTDRLAFDVAYHNRKLGDHDRNFEKAVYQPRSSGYSASAALEAKGYRDWRDG
nr:hypothetical protein B0A51_16621 [Rachicladosporium sp. CCFEE 5018]